MELLFTHYFTGKPCQRGHVSLKPVGRRSCPECEKQYLIDQKERIANYKKEYHQANKDLLCKRSREWYADNKDRSSEAGKAYYRANKERFKKLHDEWMSANRDRYLQMRKDHRNANPLLHSERRKQWKRCNPDKVLASNRNRRARKRGACGRHTAEDVAALKVSQRGKCANCRVSLASGFHVDHITALINGGSNDPHNLQLLCPGCNMSKGAKDHIQWRQLNGYLL